MSAYRERAALDHSRSMRKALADRRLWTWLFHGDALKRYFLLLNEDERVNVVSAALRLRAILNGADVVYVSSDNPTGRFRGFKGGFGPLPASEHRKALMYAEFAMEVSPEFKVIKSREAEYLA